MKYITLYSQLSLITLSAMLVLSGCSQTLVKDDTLYTNDSTAHCSGSEWVDDSSMSVLPIPILAFFMPHTDLNSIKADNYLKRCGDSSKWVNRKVELDHGLCIPASLTRILTLGIWQWCPATVSWQADVRS